jgi:serine-aspartate repeat-containing protein C/D/E
MRSDERLVAQVCATDATLAGFPLMRSANTWRAVVIGPCALWWPLDGAQARKPARSLPAVGGTVWVDADRDGIRDRGERGAANVRLSLQRAAKRRGRLVYTRVAGTASGKDGRWSFKPGKPGTYRVKVALPRGYDGFAPQRRGRARTLDSDVQPSSGLTPRAQLKPGGKTVRFDAGLLPTATPVPLPSPPSPAPPAAPQPPPFQIGGLVWRDNGDGYRDSTETVRLASTVELWTADRSRLLASTTTDGQGAWTLTVPGGVDYRVRVIQPSYPGLAPKDQGGDDARDSDFNPSGPDKGYTDLRPANTGSLSFDAAAVTPPVVGNLVWRDTNGDGRQDVGEPGEPNVTVQLWDFSKSELYDTAVTNASGVYQLRAPNTSQAYRVRVLLPAGLAFTGKNQTVSDDGIDSDVNTSGIDAGYTDVFRMALNTISVVSMDAGLIPTP